MCKLHDNEAPSFRSSVLGRSKFNQTAADDHMYSGSEAHLPFPDSYPGR